MRKVSSVELKKAIIIWITTEETAGAKPIAIPDMQAVFEKGFFCRQAEGDQQKTCPKLYHLLPSNLDFVQVSGSSFELPLVLGGFFESMGIQYPRDIIATGAFLPGSPAPEDILLKAAAAKEGGFKWLVVPAATDTVTTGCPETVRCVTERIDAEALFGIVGKLINHGAIQWGRDIASILRVRLAATDILNTTNLVIKQNMMIARETLAWLEQLGRVANLNDYLDFHMLRYKYILAIQATRRHEGGDLDYKFKEPLKKSREFVKNKGYLDREDKISELLGEAIRKADIYCYEPAYKTAADLIPVLEADPETIRPFYNKLCSTLGQVLDGWSRLEPDKLLEAEMWHMRALDGIVAEDLGRRYNYLGEHWLASGDSRAAIDSFNKARNGSVSSADRPFSCFGLGRAHLMAGDAVSALHFFEEYRRIPEKEIPWGGLQVLIVQRFEGEARCVLGDKDNGLRLLGMSLNNLKKHWEEKGQGVTIGLLLVGTCLSAAAAAKDAKPNSLMKMARKTTEAVLSYIDPSKFPEAYKIAEESHKATGSSVADAELFNNIKRKIQYGA